MVRFDGEGLLDLELIGRVIKTKVEVLQYQGKGKDSLLPGKRSSNASASTIAEWLSKISAAHVEDLGTCLPCIGWQLGEILLVHPFWSKLVCVCTENACITTNTRK